MSDKFLAVVKLKTGEEVIAKVKISPDVDAISLDCPAMIGHSNFSRKPGVSVIKIEIIARLYHGPGLPAPGHSRTEVSDSAGGRGDHVQSDWRGLGGRTH